jgi:hypothetical protein
MKFPTTGKPRRISLSIFSFFGVRRENAALQKIELEHFAAICSALTRSVSEAHGKYPP